MLRNNGIRYFIDSESSFDKFLVCSEIKMDSYYRNDVIACFDSLDQANAIKQMMEEALDRVLLFG